jgi:hypothetical protein
MILKRNKSYEAIPAGQKAGSTLNHPPTPAPAGPRVPPPALPADGPVGPTFEQWPLEFKSGEISQALDAALPEGPAPAGPTGSGASPRGSAFAGRLIARGRSRRECRNVSGREGDSFLVVQDFEMRCIENARRISEKE